MHLLALMGHFIGRNDRFTYPFIDFNKRDPYPFIHPKPEIGSFGRSLLILAVRYKEYPPGCEQLPRLLPPFSFTQHKP